MKKIEKTPSKILEYELQIKLLEYLRINNFVDDGIYNFVVNKFINKLSIEKNDDKYKSNINYYKLIT